MVKISNNSLSYRHSQKANPSLHSLASTMAIKKSCVLMTSLSQRVLMITCNIAKTGTLYHWILGKPVVGCQTPRYTNLQEIRNLHPNYQALKFSNHSHQSMTYSTQFLVIKCCYLFMFMGGGCWGGDSLICYLSSVLYDGLHLCDCLIYSKEGLTPTALDKL